MTRPINYTAAMDVGMDDTAKHIVNIDGFITELETLIKPFVQATEGQAFTQFQQVIATWRSSATEHTADQTRYVQTVRDSRTNMHDADMTAMRLLET